MGFFDTDPPAVRSYGEEIMNSHAAAHPGYTGPEVAMSGNRYPLPDADGRIVVWPGATTLAGELDNPYALQNWQLRQVARGMALRPDLVAQAGACVDDDRETLREVVRSAQNAAAVQTGANLGSALHMAFERVDRGEPIGALPEMFHADIQARQEALAQHGITILPEYRERVVRCLIHKCAGRMDGIARLSDGSLVVFDDKSEKDPTRYPHSKCVQIGIYANAGELWDYRTNTAEPMPDVRKDFALMLHSRPGEAKCEIYRVDIACGWAAAYISVQLREWRKAEGLIAPYLSEGSWVPKVESPVTPVQPEEVTDPIQEIADDVWCDSAAKLAEAAPSNGSQGLAIDPDTEIAELAALSKDDLKAMCASVGITDVAHHRAWLAREYVTARNMLGKTETEMEAIRKSGQTIAQQAQPQPVTVLETVLTAIEEAPDKKALAAIWDWWTTDHPETGDEAQQVMTAGLARMKVLENLRPVGADNPFAD